MSPTVTVRLLLAGVIACLLLPFHPAHAESRGAESDAAAKDRDARDHYNKGILHYDLGEIDAAIQEFRQAYAISAAPGLLFNIAQAYRYKKDYEQALHFYRTYLRLQPKAPNRGDVESRVAEMEQLIQQQQRVGNERPHGVIPPGGKTPVESHRAPEVTSQTPPDSTRNEVESEAEPATETVPPAAAPAPAPVAAAATEIVAPAPPRGFLKTSRGIATIAVGAVGAASLITAAALGGVALSTRNDYRDGCATGLCDQGRYDRARSLAIGTDVLIGVGVAAVATSAILFFTRPKSSKRAGLYAPSSTAGGLVWGTF